MQCGYGVSWPVKPRAGRPFLHGVAPADDMFWTGKPGPGQQHGVGWENLERDSGNRGLQLLLISNMDQPEFLFPCQVAAVEKLL
eukprot:g23082.t1